MRINLRKGSQRYEILDLHESHSDDTLKPFRSKSAALNFLRGFSRDPINMTSMRKFLARRFAQSGRRRLPDHKVLEHIALRLSSGQLRIAVLPVSILTSAYKTSAYKAPVIEEEIAEPAAVASVDPHWIKLRIVDEETDEPFEGVSVKIKLPSGEVKKFTTDGNGTIEVKGVPEGTWDIEEMMDLDALEVVEVA